MYIVSRSSFFLSLVSLPVQNPVRSQWIIIDQLYRHHESHYKARRTFPFVYCRLHPPFYLFNNLKRRSMSPPTFLLSHSYKCMHTYCVHHNHLFVIYIHIYIEHTYTEEINNHDASKRDGITTIVLTIYIYVRPTLMQATSSLSHLF
jgi:hypothetical protein